MILAAQAVLAVVALPVAALLVRDAVRRRRPVASIATAAAVLVTGTQWLTALDPDRWQSILNAIAHPATLILLATYPNGRFTPRWTIVVVAAGTAVQVGNVVSGFELDTQAWWPFHYLLTWIPLLIGGQLFRFRRRSTVEERRRTSWPLLAAIVQFVAFAVGSSLQVGATGSLDGLEWATALSFVLNSLIPFGFAVGLLAPGLFRVDRALRAVIAVAVVAFGLLTVFAASTGLLPLVGVSRQGASWIGALAIAILTWPLGRFGARAADRLVYGALTDPLAALTALGARLAAPLGPLDVPSSIAETIALALALPGVRIEFADGRTTATGAVIDGRDAERFPIVYQGELLATIVVAPRMGEPELSAGDRETIAHLARQAGPALRDARTIEDLVEARARVVLSREEERRRLRRDLHDDLAPTFAGLGLGAEAVRAFAADGDRRAVQVAESLVAALADATRQVREIAYDLRPPVLDDRGLVAAIRDRVELPGTRPEVTLEAPSERLELPAAVEIAALRIAQEAVLNVRRHAAATRCRVTVRRDDDELSVVVDDDGVGLPEPRIDGVGLHSMRERVAELGGRLDLERLEPGTRVRAVLPLTTSALRHSP